MHCADYCLYTTDFQTRFRAPIPTNTHSVIFNFSPEERKNVLDISSTFNNGVTNFQKSVMSSIYAAERKHLISVSKVILCHLEKCLFVI